MLWYKFIYVQHKENLGQLDPTLQYFSDNMFFHLDGHMNTQYSRKWSIGNPQFTHFVKVGVWWL
jgi:hypothetical protein